MSADSRQFWFRLVDDATGKIYPNTDADKVSVNSIADVADFRDAVYLKTSKNLTSVNALNLKVYKDMASFEMRNAAVDEEKEYPLSPTDPLGVRGREDKMLIVVVPDNSRADHSVVTPLSKQPKYSWNRKRVPLSLSFHEMDSASNTFEFHEGFLSDFELSERSILYCRRAFYDK